MQKRFRLFCDTANYGRFLDLVSNEASAPTESGIILDAITHFWLAVQQGTTDRADRFRRNVTGGDFNPIDGILFTEDSYGEADICISVDLTDEVAELSSKIVENTECDSFSSVVCEALYYYEHVIQVAS